MRRNRPPLATLALATLVLGAALTACGGPTFRDEDVQTGCGSDHPRVGFAAELATRYHGVRGTVRAVDDCTLVIEGFHYDGGGLDVRVMGVAAGTDFADGQILTDDILGQSFAGETLTIPLPNGLTLDDIEEVSVWCLVAGVSFGDGELRAPATTEPPEGDADQPPSSSNR